VTHEVLFIGYSGTTGGYFDEAQKITAVEGGEIVSDVGSGICDLDKGQNLLLRTRSAKLRGARKI
jgi:hypothetical protein